MIKQLATVFHADHTSIYERIAARTRGLVPAVFLFSIVALAPQASMGVTHAGSVCKPLFFSDAPYVYYSIDTGVHQTSSGVLKVICPLVRFGHDEYGATFTVYVLHMSKQTTTCEASINYPSGKVLVNQAKQQTFGGLSAFTFNLTGLGKSTPDSSFAVECEIPGEAQAYVTSIILEGMAHPID